MPSRRQQFLLCLLLIAAKSSAQATAGEKQIDFARQVQPILAEHCSQCHGVDQDARKGGLRLDTAEDALRGGESGERAIVPEHPEQSELIRRIISSDQDTLMPPPSTKNPLSEAQIETLKQWIAQGAQFESHWAFTAPQKISLPAGHSAHPVDSIVSSRLQEDGLAISASASSSALCRRLYLDLIGLPPTPQQLADFETQGLEATADKLLQSRQYAEKWARHWLDVARYSDTNGYEKDLQREQWAWRDWVINAIDQDMPYDQFLIEQIAGDLLPGATQDQIIATGFLRNSMINEEGAIVAEQFRMVEMFDRIDCIGKGVLGLSTQCAQCHSHKFDPVSHTEYYGMFAFLNNSWEARSWVYSKEQQQTLQDLRNRMSALEGQMKEQRPQWLQEQSQWEAALTSQLPPWVPVVTTELGSISGLNHPVQEADKSIIMLGHTSADVFMISAPDLKGITGLQLEALNHGDLPHRGPGRSSTGTWGISELEVFTKAPGSSEWQKVKLVSASADFSSPENKQPDGKKATGPVSFLIDGSDDTTWVSDRGIGRRNQPSVAVIQFEQPLDAPEGTELKIAMRMTDMLGCCRFSLTTHPQPSAPPVDHAITLAIQKPAAERSDVQQTAVFNGWCRTVPEFKAINDQIDELWKSWPTAVTSILHLSERPARYARTTSLLDRGNWDQPRQPIEPHTPAAFHNFPADASRDRLGFARWLADRKSPLTARVAVNRVWQAIFGEGLVETPEDFGTRAPVPEYRELLDWLSVDFMEHGWSQKHLIRTIVTSAVWRQSSQASPEMLERDPRNRLLARGPRFRAEAEVIRDIALSVSGLLSERKGGPGVIPPVPQNVLDYNYVYPSYWKPAEGSDRYCRTVYGFRKRSMPDPVMTSFDAPNGDFSCVRRVRSNTPLAALTALNETIFVEAARALALRILREAGDSDSSRADYAFLLCMSRHPDDQEREEVLALLKSRRERIADGWLNAREISTGDAAKLPELPAGTTPQDAAAWTLVARVLLNLDETLSKN